MKIKAVEKMVGVLLEGGKKFVSSECKRLLSDGENYGSVMLDLTIKLENEDGAEEIVNCVAKTCPPKGIWWAIFNIPVTVKKEIAFYQIVVPTLNNFGRENGIETAASFFAKCYGGRISLDPSSDEVDMDAALLLENLKSRGFRTGDRFVGYNRKETQLILKHLALFHAIPLAHKVQKPKEFKEKIQPYLRQDMKFQPPPDMTANIMSFLKEIASTSSKLACVFSRIEQNFRRYREEVIVNPPNIREPFATMAHNDCWVNNIMLRYQNGTPVENIFVDFQCIDYNSPAHDLLFFLYTSVELSLVKSDFDDLVKYYFNVFSETLKKYNCSTEQFSFQKFMEEMDIVATDYQLFHILLMLQPIYMKKEEAQELSEMEKILSSTTEKSFHENFYQKALFIMFDFDKRGWV